MVQICSCVLYDLFLNKFFFDKMRLKRYAVDKGLFRSLHLVFTIFSCDIRRLLFLPDVSQFTAISILLNISSALLLDSTKKTVTAIYECWWFRTTWNRNRYTQFVSTKCLLTFRGAFCCLFRCKLLKEWTLFAKSLVPADFSCDFFLLEILTVFWEFFRRASCRKINILQNFWFFLMWEIPNFFLIIFSNFTQIFLQKSVFYFII